MRGEASFAFIRGAPGVGKTTVGQLLLDRLRGGAVLEVDRFRAMLGGCDWSDRRQHHLAIRAALHAARELAIQSVAPIYVIDTFCRDRLDVARDLLPEGASDMALSLWANDTVLKGRLEQRARGFQDWEQARLMNDEVASVRLDRETLLDTSALTAEEVAAWVLAAVEERVA